jgi:hypothetical protein
MGAARREIPPWMRALSSCVKYCAKALSDASGFRVPRPDRDRSVGVRLAPLPELFGGQGADEVFPPVPYPASCRPQAWAAASGITVARALGAL